MFYTQMHIFDVCECVCVLFWPPSQYKKQKKLHFYSRALPLRS